jgi:predicted TIM-barrel enzyme
MPPRLFISRHRRALIIVIHLLPLPASPRWGGNFRKVIRWARADAQAGADGGANAIIIENFGDAPFYKCEVPAETVAAMAVVGAAVRETVKIADWFQRSAQRRARSIGTLWIVWRRLRPGKRPLRCHGHRSGDNRRKRLRGDTAAPAARPERENSGRHSRQTRCALANVPLEIAARDTVERGLADALVVSGSATGQTTSLDDVKRVRSACPQIPILIGSGATVANGASYLQFADGLIVGTWVKRDGKVSNPVDRNRVAALRKAIE